MSKRIDVTVSDAIYDAVIEQAAKEGFANDRDSGKRQIVVRALHYWLNQRGRDAAALRMNDMDYQTHKQSVSTRVEGAQK